MKKLSFVLATMAAIAVAAPAAAEDKPMGGMEKPMMPPPPHARASPSLPSPHDEEADDERKEDVRPYQSLRP